ncbi:MAG: hypothetical protein AAF721_23880 [Myxococcota bacterium]
MPACSADDSDGDGADTQAAADDADDADDSTFGTGLTCFTFPGGEVQAPADWPYAIPDGLVLGSFDNVNPGSSNVAGATGDPTGVLDDLTNNVFSALSPTVGADDTNNRVYTFGEGDVTGQIQAFSPDGGFETPTCIRIIISYVDAS